MCTETEVEMRRPRKRSYIRLAPTSTDIPNQRTRESEGFFSNRPNDITLYSDIVLSNSGLFDNDHRICKRSDTNTVAMFTQLFKRSMFLDRLQQRSMPGNWPFDEIVASFQIEHSRTASKSTVWAVMLQLQEKTSTNFQREFGSHVFCGSSSTCLKM